MLDRIGAVVKEVRQRLGWSAADLAHRADAGLAVIEGLEAGRPGVTTRQFDEIARALELDAQALRAGREVAKPTPSVYLRHRGIEAFGAEDQAVLDAAIEDARVLDELNALVGAAGTPWRGRRGAAPHDAADVAAKDSDHVATELRKHLNLPTQPFDDLREVVEEQLGIVVLVRNLSTHRACAVKVGDAVAIVLDAATYESSIIRARVAIAQGTSHVLHDPDYEGVYIVLDTEDDRGTHDSEQRACAHAAELLLPRVGLDGLLGVPRAVPDPGTAVDLVSRAMDHFGATWQLTANQLCSHKFVDHDLREWLETADVHAVPTRWPMRLPPSGGPSLLVAQRTRRAHEEALITDGEARSILGIEAIVPLPWEPAL